MEIVKVDDNGDEVVKETTFRRELLTRCQKEFEKDKRDDETKEEYQRSCSSKSNINYNNLIVYIHFNDYYSASLILYYYRKRGRLKRLSLRSGRIKLVKDH